MAFIPRAQQIKGGGGKRALAIKRGVEIGTPKFARHDIQGPLRVAGARAGAAGAWAGAAGAQARAANIQAQVASASGLEKERKSSWL